VIGRDPDQPLFPELIPQGTGMRRSAAFTGRFAHYKQKTKIRRPRMDFHSFRGNVETDLKNLPSTNQAWIDELIGHESTIRRSEGERYTKQNILPILQRLVNSIRINADLSHLEYAGEFGVAAPNRDHELTRFVALAEREMKKKVKLGKK
jgi:porphobilinogen deaminase